MKIILTTIKLFYICLAEETKEAIMEAKAEFHIHLVDKNGIELVTLG